MKKRKKKGKDDDDDDWIFDEEDLEHDEWEKQMTKEFMADQKLGLSPTEIKVLFGVFDLSEEGFSSPCLDYEDLFEQLEDWVRLSALSRFACTRVANLQKCSLFRTHSKVSPRWWTVWRHSPGQTQTGQRDTSAG